MLLPAFIPDISVVVLAAAVSGCVVEDGAVCADVDVMVVGWMDVNVIRSVEVDVLVRVLERLSETK